jgi:hypothetical protein
MKLFLLAVLLAASTGQAHAADVGVSVSVGEPGFYGRIDIGDYPAPQLIYRQPRLIQREGVDRQPIYMHVPNRHARNWRRHCSRYNACDERVYFVRDNWYNREYVPRYQERNHNRQDWRHDGRHDNRRGNDRNDRNDGQRGGYDRDQNR